MQSNILCMFSSLEKKARSVCSWTIHCAIPKLLFAIQIIGGGLPPSCRCVGQCSYHQGNGELRSGTQHICNFVQKIVFKVWMITTHFILDNLYHCCIMNITCIMCINVGAWNVYCKFICAWSLNMGLSSEIWIYIWMPGLVKIVCRATELTLVETFNHRQVCICNRLLNFSSRLCVRERISGNTSAVYIQPE